MTLEEKKSLYRASFANTLAEIDAPEGFWKTAVGGFGFGLGLTILVFCAMVEFGKSAGDKKYPNQEF